MLGGMVIGSIRMVFDFVFREPNCGEEETRPAMVVMLSIHYMYFALMLVLLTTVIDVVISLLTDPPTKQQVMFNRWLQSAR